MLFDLNTLNDKVISKLQNYNTLGYANSFRVGGHDDWRLVQNELRFWYSAAAVHVLQLRTKRTSI